MLCLGGTSRPVVRSGIQSSQVGAAVPSHGLRHAGSAECWSEPAGPCRAPSPVGPVGMERICVGGGGRPYLLRGARRLKDGCDGCGRRWQRRPRLENVLSSAATADGEQSLVSCWCSIFSHTLPRTCVFVEIMSCREGRRTCSILAQSHGGCRRFERRTIFA